MEGPDDWVVTCVMAVAELSLMSGSDSVALAEAVLLSCPVDWGTTRILSIAELPTPILPKSQVTIVVPEHVPCVALTETKVTPAGKASETITPVAGDGPLFVTTILYVRLLETMAGFGEAVFVTARFALVGPATIRNTVLC